VVGAIGEDEIAEEERRDATSSGAEAAAGARAAMPTPEAKAEAWRLLTESDAVTVGVHRKIARHFWQPEQLDITAPYVDRYLEILPSFWRERPADMAWGFTEALFPSLLVDESTLARVDGVLDTDLAGSPRRLLLEQRSDLQRALRTRAVDAAPEPAPA
jgi:aminopeptidase N